jgi:Arc/MetJ-type ribon-helix-helix transcriptional regulator
MTLTLSPEHERMVNEEFRAGRYRSAEEVIGCALEALREKDLGILLRGEKRDPKRATARIRERRKGVTLARISH